VYLGGTRFSARAYAPNFGDRELRDALAYAHVHGVKGYVTVNTLVTDRELSEAGEYLIRLHEMGADGVLVQDTGLAALAREVVPDLPLHASTQMTVHSREGVAWAAAHGFARVVLAREVPLPEVQAIAREGRKAGVGIEVFIHGALCYSYSGQCLLSSFIGGRSGNRGMCAQPCRKPYTLVRGEVDAYGRPTAYSRVPLPERYLLSTRDLSAYPVLDRVVRAGVAALKIEGRMRSPGYVAAVTSIYRRALDRIREGTWQPSDEDQRDLALAFNRGFTTGYLGGASRGEIMGRSRPDNRGVRIGTVVRSDPATGHVEIRVDGKLVPSAGDGIAFSPGHGGETTGLVLRKHPVRNGDCLILRGAGVVPNGAEVYLTHRREREDRTLSRRDTPAPVGRVTVPVEVTVTWEPDGRPILEGRFLSLRGVSLAIRFPAGFTMPPAETHPTSEAAVREALSRTGDSLFRFSPLALRYPGGLFARPADLNRFRREFLERIGNAYLGTSRGSADHTVAAQSRLGDRLRELPGRSQRRGSASGPPGLALYVDTPEAAAAAMEGGCCCVYFEPQLRSQAECLSPDPAAGHVRAEIRERILRSLTNAADAMQGSGVPLVWKWPRITRRSFLDAAAPLLPGIAPHLAGLMVEGTGAAEAAMAACPGLPLRGGAGLNVGNLLSVQALSPPFQSLALSPELPLRDLGLLAAAAGSGAGGPVLEYPVQGNQEVMVSQDCMLRSLPGIPPEQRARAAESPFLGLQDERRRVFPLSVDAECRTVIRNSVETCMVDHLPSLLETHIPLLAIDARDRTPVYTGRITEIYRQGIGAAAHDGQEARRILEDLKEEIRKIARGGITTAHLLKGPSAWEE
jgi:putative protease